MSGSTGNDIAQSLAGNIQGKVVLVTGGTLGGMGTEFAATIIKHSPKLVILTARTQDKIDESFNAICKNHPDAPLRGLILDLSSLEDVRRAAAEVNSYSEVVEVLVHNAGLGGVPFSKSVDGFELHTAVNHLGPFLLTKLLLPKMLTLPKPPRIVIVASGVHAMCPGFPFDDPEFKNQIPGELGFYPQSKVLNVLFASALARKSGGRVQAFSVDPGWIGSNLSRYLPQDKLAQMGYLNPDGTPSNHLGSLNNGIRSYLVAAFSNDFPEGALGGYIGSDGKYAPEQVAASAKGVDLEEKLWDMSEKFVGEKFVL